MFLTSLIYVPWTEKQKSKDFWNLKFIKSLIKSGFLKIGEKRKFYKYIFSFMGFIEEIGYKRI